MIAGEFPINVKQHVKAGPAPAFLIRPIQSVQQPIFWMKGGECIGFRLPASE